MAACLSIPPGAAPIGQDLEKTANFSFSGVDPKQSLFHGILASLRSPLNDSGWPGNWTGETFRKGERKRYKVAKMREMMIVVENLRGIQGGEEEGRPELGRLEPIRRNA